MKKFYWGKIRKIRRKVIKEWMGEPMTRDEMMEIDSSYRHLRKEIV